MNIVLGCCCCVFRLFAHVICTFFLHGTHFVLLGYLLLHLHIPNRLHIWPAILNLFCVVCCLKWKINKKAECVEQTTRNRETETNNWLCVFRTKSQSSIYFVRLLFLLCSLFYRFFRFVLNFIRFYLVKITCKTHFIRMFLRYRAIAAIYAIRVYNIVSSTEMECAQWVLIVL